MRGKRMTGGENAETINISSQVLQTQHTLYPCDSTEEHDRLDEYP
jgi:hypothetical protein